MEASAAVPANNTNLATNPTNQQPQHMNGTKVTKVQQLINKMFKQPMTNQTIDNRREPTWTGTLDLGSKQKPNKPTNPTTSYTHPRPCTQLKPITPKPPITSRPSFIKPPILNPRTTTTPPPTLNHQKPTLPQTPKQPKPLKPDQLTQPTVSYNQTHATPKPQPNTSITSNNPNQQPNPVSMKTQSPHPNLKRTETTPQPPKNPTHPTQAQRTRKGRGTPRTRKNLPKPEEVAKDQQKMTRFLIRREDSTTCKEENGRQEERRRNKVVEDGRQVEDEGGTRRENKKIETSKPDTDTPEPKSEAEQGTPTKPATVKPLLEQLLDEKPVSVKSRIEAFTTKFENPRLASRDKPPPKPRNILKCEPLTLVLGRRRPSENLMGHDSISCGNENEKMDMIGEHGPRGGNRTNENTC